MRGHVRQRGKDPKSWTLVVDLGPDPVTGKRRQKWHTFHGTRKQADTALADLISDIEHGRYVLPQPKLTTGEYLYTWLKTWAAHNVSPRTFEGYELNVRLHIEPYLGNVLMKRLAPGMIQDVYGKLLGSGLSNRTVRYVHATLHVALKHALQWGLVVSNPADAAQPPKVIRHEVAVLTPEALQVILDALRGEPLYAPVLLAAATGLRRGELLGLTWSQVDLDNRVLHVTQTLAGARDGVPEFAPVRKGRSRRAIAIPEVALAELLTLREAQRRNAGELGGEYRDFGLVICREDGHAWRGDNLGWSFRKRMDRLGFPQIRFHDLRHTHATLLLWQGVHPKVVSERLGHAQIGITMDTYSHVMPVMQREAADALDRALSGSPREGLQNVSKQTEKAPRG